MHTIENSYLSIEVSIKGAELKKVFDKQLKQERMWTGDPALWGRVSPVLFPIVGKVKDGFYLYEGQSFKLPQHGFLRDRMFNLKSKTKDSLVFSFESSDEEFKVYPFKHAVLIEYRLEGPALKVLWTVKNLGEESMYYSIGAHPGFLLDPSKEYEFVFPNEKQANHYALKEGLLGDYKKVALKAIDIKVGDFKDDATIYGEVSSVTLRAQDLSEFVQVNFKGFPFVGLWSVYNQEERTPFVCIEPWHGIADQYTSDQDFTKKLGIRKLKALASETLEYEMVFNER